jgi:PAS domain-containing protein
MTDYVVNASAMLLVVVIGLAGYLFARKWQARKIAAATEGAMLRTLVDNLPDLIYVKDVNGRFLLANVAEARIMGAKAPRRQATCWARMTLISTPGSLRLAITRTSRS